MSLKLASSRLWAGLHSSLEFNLHARGDSLTLVQAIANLPEPRMTTGGVNLVVGFRPKLRARVASEVALIPNGSAGAGAAVDARCLRGRVRSML